MTGMTSIFVGLACWNSVFFAATLWLALTNNPWHWAAGLVTGIFTLLVHSIVFMHFIGTGKGIKEAVEIHEFTEPQPGYVQRTKRIKARVFPMSTFASLAIIVAIWLGGWYHSQRWLDHVENVTAFNWHRWFAWCALAFNFYVFYVEWRAIRENTAMIREINARLAAPHPAGSAVAPPL